MDKEIENAINGVKEMKTVMEKSEEDHKTFLSSLEETRKQKEVRDFQTDSDFFFFFLSVLDLHVSCALGSPEGRTGYGEEAER